MKAVPPLSHSWRYLEEGARISLPKGYADQPYFLRANDGALVLVCTICHSHEGDLGQHVVSLRSEDDGDTWSEPVPLEPSLEVESSYAVIIKAPYGRIYAFYNHNTDNIRKVPGDREAFPDGWCRRVDSLGYFVFKYSDDHGKSWSENRRVVPVREFEIDRKNTSSGKIRYFWNVGKAFWRGGEGYIPLHKVGGFGKDFFTRSEGALIKVPNLGEEKDPEKLEFETLPKGEVGIRAPKDGGGPIAEEHSFVVLSDQSIYTVFRTISGYAAFAYSRDGGETWSDAEFLQYPNGKRIKNPRAANFIWKLNGDRYLYWFHNHSGKSYADRNPVWCLTAREVDGDNGKCLEFSQPEILLYTDDITRRMSYPDCMELPEGDLLLTETEKRTCRIHRIPKSFIHTILHQWESWPIPSEKNLVLNWERNDNKGSSRAEVTFPVMYDREGGWEAISGRDLRGGVTFVFTIGARWVPGTLMDNRTENGRGMAIFIRYDQRIEIVLNDGRSESRWVFMQLLESGQSMNVSIVIDGGPKVVYGIFDGVFDDGKERQFGFGLFNPFLQSLNGEVCMEIFSSIEQLKIFNRPLLTAEAVSLYRIGGQTAEMDVS